jgi:hypothetical protein
MLAGLFWVLYQNDFSLTVDRFSAFLPPPAFLDTLPQDNHCLKFSGQKKPLQPIEDWRGFTRVNENINTSSEPWRALFRGVFHWIARDSSQLPFCLHKPGSKP